MNQPTVGADEKISVVKGHLSIIVHIVIVAISLSVIAYLNFSLIRYWFEGEVNQNMASIEISYIQMAKFWVESRGAGWQPLWYLGYPWHVFYTPALPTLEVLGNQVLDLSFAQAYRAITGAGFVLVPISLYLFVWQITKSKSGAMIAAFAYSLAPSLISLLFGEVRNDSISGLLEPRRFTILVRWGEGPHTLALVFLPLFGVFLSRYLDSRKFGNLLAASFFLGLIALTNAIVVWAAILLILALFLAEITKKNINVLGLFRSLLAIVVLAFGLIAFWYNWPFLKTFFREGSGALANWLAMFPWGLILFLAIVFLLFLFIKKLTKDIEGAATAIFWFLMLFAIVFVYYASGGTGEARLEYAPQALRLNTEVDLAASVLAGVLISKAFLFLSSKAKDFYKVPVFILAILVWLVPAFLLLIWGNQLLQQLPIHTKSIAESKIGSIENTPEYRVAGKLGELTTGTNQRVLAPGNYGFWLNFFEPVPQLRGGLFQSSTHFWPEHIYYQITNGPNGQISLAWLKIANIGQLVYTTPASAETYKDYKVPEEKFASILTEKWREAGDIYFAVPLKNDSLAKVVDYKTLLAINKPENAIDSEPIFGYVGEIEKKSSQRVEVTKISASHWKLTGEIAKDEGILFQITYDVGWSVKARAGQNGRWKIVKDPLDFMILVPTFAKASEGKPVNFEIELVYSKPWSVYLGYLITLVTVGWIITRLIKVNQGKLWGSKGIKS